MSIRQKIIAIVCVSSPSIGSVARIERSEIPGPPDQKGNAAPGFRWRSTRATGLRLVASLFRLDIRRLNDRPPLLDLGALDLCKRFGRLLIAQRNVQPEVGEP